MILRNLSFWFLALSMLFAPTCLFAQDKLISILDEEVQREMKYLKTQEVPAYYISYRVEETTDFSVSTSFGSLTASSQFKKRVLTVSVRVGSPLLDNYHSGYVAGGSVMLPIEDEPLAIRQVLWNTTFDAYQQGIEDLARLKTNISLKIEEEDKSPDFSDETPNVSIAPAFTDAEISLDKNAWEKRMRSYSAGFLKDSSIFNGSGLFSFQATRKYFVSSNGDKIAENKTLAEVFISGVSKAQDGMVLPLVQSWSAAKPENLPSDEIMQKEVTTMVKNLVALKNAPVADPYSGPALLSGRASGVFFHEIFGHRVEGQRLKKSYDAQTFKKKINEQVLPACLSVYCDPNQKAYQGHELNGYYQYDDQGVKGQHVSIVENGILKNFLMSRVPITGFPKSNGHGRAAYGSQPVARQSNLIVENNQPHTEAELHAQLIKLAKEQNKPYAYLFDDVVGGFTTTDRFNPNAFNVTPTLVYRVYTDGRPDELVRGVNLIGTPLSMFSQIDQAGGTSDIFNGYCGAESGSIPVSCVSPMMLVRQIETQKKAKSQDLPLILPRPGK